MRSSLAVVLVLAACRDADRAPAREVPAATPVAEPAAFGLYVLALTWAPSFCCTHAGKEECRGLDGSFAATHLTLHGLWPNYTDAEARGRQTYPQFCGDYARCESKHDASCAPDPKAIPEEMRVLGPGYVGDHDFLADHEWPKHGSCTGLTPAAYFMAALGAMKALPGDGTPAALGAAIGGDVALADLQGGLGVPRESVLLSCDAHCQLSQLSVCLAHDARGLPTTPVACPANTTKAQYDNGCVTRGCERVSIPAAGSCGAPRPTGQAPKPIGNGCEHPGQGPACGDNASCVRAGYLRCARSGCCTSQR